MADLFTVLTPREAWSMMEPHLHPIDRVETTATTEALGRVLAEDTRAPADLPHFARSAMDGYAVRAEDTHGATEGLPAYLKVVGEVAMGKPATVKLSPGEAALIHTGGMLAVGADAVVMVENTRSVDASMIEVVRPVAKGENVIQIGEDMAKGDALLPCGSLLRPQDIGSLLSLGITRVSVFQKVKAALIPTGDELVPPETEPGPGQIRNTNAFALAAMAAKAGAMPIVMDIAPDNDASLKATTQRALDLADIVVVSAGSSVSTRDMTSRVVDSLGKPGVLVHGVSLRPGKPTILAAVGRKPVFGLPGNPASAMVTFGIFVTPAIHRLSGCSQPPQRFAAKAKLTRNIPSATGREDYVPVRIEEKDGELYADPVFGKSNLLFAMIRADGLARVPLDKAGMTAGELVDVTLF
ncbi:MAG: molybdopterin molybdotransferase MoeA [Dehalococcoidia bacterium]|nr:molybdopterin molybdotransferase MoeA [Dehalococcoidia bacterium]